MRLSPRISGSIAIVCLSMLFFFPIWKITLVAPQYPDGIRLYIWINQITGDSPGTLQNINILNHYIGMKYIEPESIPELRYFPYIVAGLMLAGVATVIIRKRSLFLAWFVMLVLLSAAGIYDLYLWEYDYGHNLAPNAPIKVPGMTYQPPLLGNKDLLNFKATSLPATGGVLLGLGIVFSFMAFLRSDAGKKALAVASLAPFLLPIQSCTVEPEPVHYGQDACSYCKMTIVDERYAAQLVTRKGKVFKFDATECLLQFRQEQPDIVMEARLELVTDYRRPRQLVPAETAYFLRSRALPSPMGMYITAAASEEEAGELQAEYGGQIYSYEGLLSRFKKWSE